MHVTTGVLTAATRTGPVRALPNGKVELPARVCVTLHDDTFDLRHAAVITCRHDAGCHLQEQSTHAAISATGPRLAAVRILAPSRTCLPVQWPPQWPHPWLSLAQPPHPLRYLHRHNHCTLAHASKMQKSLKDSSPLSYRSSPGTISLAP
jgi:hypothetical protein